MTTVVSFTSPHAVVLIEEPAKPLVADQVRIRTLFSGISAGTELTAYRGSNPYLSKRWDEDRRLFIEGLTSFEYPIIGWGYEEVGEVVEVGSHVTKMTIGDRVWGVWGHRSEVIQDEEYALARVLSPKVDPRLGIFSQIGAIALNVILDADIHVGETVVVFGLGVLGQIVAQLARINGAYVIGVDGIASRRELALKLGADEVLGPTDGGIAEWVRAKTDGRGADVCLEVSGNYDALQEAIRTVAYSSRVCVAGFMQGEGIGLRLGEEFHHNRVALVSSQISGVSQTLQHRWNEYRLASTAVRLAEEGKLRLIELISHEIPTDDVSSAFAILDTNPQDALQVVLKFGES